MSEEMRDEPLSAPTTDATKTAKDEPLGGGTPEGFDLAAWVRGVVPARKTVTLYQRPDLLAEIDRLSALHASAVGVDADRFEAEAREVTQELLDSSIRVVIEGHRSSRVEAGMKRAKASGLKDDVDVVLHQLADQIVEPAGMTLVMLQHLADVIEPQVSAMVSAMMAVNAEAVRPDPRFLPAS